MLFAARALFVAILSPVHKICLSAVTAAHSSGLWCSRLTRMRHMLVICSTISPIVACLDPDNCEFLKVQSRMCEWVLPLWQ
jgi:hypothetical protein